MSRTQILSDFCKGFSEEADQWPNRFTNVSMSPEQREALRSACARKGTVVVRPHVSVNASNVDWGRIFKEYATGTFAVMVESLASGLHVYAIATPFGNISSTSGAWRQTNDKPTDKERNPQTAFDSMAIEALATSTGARNVIINQSAPAGTIIFNVMSTSLFTIAVILTMLFLYPLLSMASRVAAGGRWIDYRRYPGTIFGLLLGTWALVIYLLLNAMI